MHLLFHLFEVYLRPLDLSVAAFKHRILFMLPLRMDVRPWGTVECSAPKAVRAGVRYHSTIQATSGHLSSTAVRKHIPHVRSHIDSI